MRQTDNPTDGDRADSRPRRIFGSGGGYTDVCFVAAGVGAVLLWAYSVMRWIGDPTWLGASSPGFAWVPHLLATVASLANFLGVIAFLRCVLRGSFWTRILTLLPGVFLSSALCWIVVQSFKVYVMQ